jgi:membrane-associated protease RseP (regulator of RpoE activity)
VDSVTEPVHPPPPLKLRRDAEASGEGVYPQSRETYPVFVSGRLPKFQDRVSRQVVLLLLTIATTTVVGADHYRFFASNLENRQVALSLTALLLHGFWYSGTILAILGCHELGHYFACRYYDVDASLPYFLPVPLPMTGTLGAFIRIREQIPRKKMLFDIGIAGPLAGFAVAVPALVLGLAMSHLVQVPADFYSPEHREALVSLGEPLLFKLAEYVRWGTQPNGYELNMHPVAFAAWFGLLATALNLFPIGQLDGGHISYAVLGKRSTLVTFVMIGVAIGLIYFSRSWLVWTTLMVVMLKLFGARHPPVFDEDVPLDRTRQVLAVVALAIFVLCFTPAPVSAFLGK